MNSWLHGGANFGVWTAFWNPSGLCYVEFARYSGGSAEWVYIPLIAVFVIFALFYGFPLIDHLMDRDRFLVRAVFATVVLSAAIIFVSWTGFVVIDSWQAGGWWFMGVMSVLIGISQSMKEEG